MESLHSLVTLEVPPLPSRIGADIVSTASRFTSQTRQKRLARALELFFKSARAIALRACPRFSAVQITAVPTRVRIFDADQIEVFLPVRTLFLEWNSAEANLHPMRGAVVSYARLCISQRYSSPATEPRPSLPSSIALSRASSLPGFTRAFTKYRMASLHCRGIVDL